MNAHKSNAAQNSVIIYPLPLLEQDFDENY